MAKNPPRQLTPSEKRARRTRVLRIARGFGFVGQVEYRHLFSQTGGAQYGVGRFSHEDQLTVFAEAFERDADPADFSLEAIVAHECGHQLLLRHPRISRRVSGRISVRSEEILASLLGAMLSRTDVDRDALIAKAVVELLAYGETPEIAVQRLQDLWDLFKALL